MPATCDGFCPGTCGSPTCEGAATRTPPVVWCKCCGREEAKPGDRYGRGDWCIADMLVPDRRGGWRQLGVYDG